MMSMRNEAISSTSALLQQREENGFQEKTKVQHEIWRLGLLISLYYLLYITTLEIKYNHIW
jgi:hypothetical protein